MYKRIAIWTPVLLYMAFIFYLSSQVAVPGPSVQPFPYYDKIVHIVMFAVLSLLFWGAWKYERITSPYFYAIAFTILYGISDEFHQSFVPGRIADMWDVVADGIGSLVVLLWKRKQ